MLRHFHLCSLLWKALSRTAIMITGLARGVDIVRVNIRGGESWRSSGERLSRSARGGQAINCLCSNWKRVQGGEKNPGGGGGKNPVLHNDYFSTGC